jgi:hypothetical protein
MYLRAIAKCDKTAFVPFGGILAKSGHSGKGYFLMFYGLLQLLLSFIRNAWEAGLSSPPFFAGFPHNP